MMPDITHLNDPLAAQRLAKGCGFVRQTAAADARIGPLVESLKWGEPSFTPARRKVGSSVRLALRDQGRIAFLFICHTGLVAEFREIYPGLDYEGQRAIVIDPADDWPTLPLQHCITRALTYFLRG